MPMARRVVVLEHAFPNLDTERRILQPAGIEVIDGERLGAEERSAAMRDADALLLRRIRVDAGLIETLERCVIICSYGVGYDSIDIEAATARGILVANTPGYSNDEVADHALAMALSLTRRMPPQMRDLQAAARGDGEVIWTHLPYQPIRRVRGQTLGIIGLGRIGRTLAWKAQGIGLRVIATDPYLLPATAQALNVELVPLDELLRTSDIVSLHTPLTAETFHLIGPRELALMRPSAYLINCARGPIVDLPALLDALRHGQIAGAGLDVLEPEPPPVELLRDLLDLPNVIVTPHNAWYSEESIEDRQRLAAETVRLALAGAIPEAAINRPAEPRALRQPERHGL